MPCTRRVGLERAPRRRRAPRRARCAGLRRRLEPAARHRSNSSRTGSPKYFDERLRELVHLRRRAHDWLRGSSAEAHDAPSRPMQHAVVASWRAAPRRSSSPMADHGGSASRRRHRTADAADAVAAEHRSRRCTLAARGSLAPHSRACDGARPRRCGAGVAAPGGALRRPPAGRNASMRSSVISNPVRGSGASAQIAPARDRRLVVELHVLGGECASPAARAAPAS